MDSDDEQENNRRRILVTAISRRRFLVPALAVAYIRESGALEHGKWNDWYFNACRAI